MKHGIPTTEVPNRPECLYIRNLYHTFFWGPFHTEAELEAAVAHLDKADPLWDYDPFTIIRGANPLPRCYTFGFERAPAALCLRVFDRPRERVVL